MDDRLEMNNFGDGPTGDQRAATEVKMPTAAKEDREQWTSKMDFIMSCVGYAIGLGNVRPSCTVFPISPEQL